MHIIMVEKFAIEPLLSRWSFADKNIHFINIKLTPFPRKVVGCMSVSVYVQQDLVNCWVDVYKLIKAISLHAKGEAISLL